nr:MAG TPA: hypothetical protein [Caudoviricetes sp.]
MTFPSSIMISALVVRPDVRSKYVFFSFAALVSRRALAEAGTRMASIRLAVITLPNPT